MSIPDCLDRVQQPHPIHVTDQVCRESRIPLQFAHLKESRAELSQSASLQVKETALAHANKNIVCAFQSFPFIAGVPYLFESGCDCFTNSSAISLHRPNNVQKGPEGFDHARGKLIHVRKLIDLRSSFWHSLLNRSKRPAMKVNFDFGFLTHFQGARQVWEAPRYQAGAIFVRWFRRAPSHREKFGAVSLLQSGEFCFSNEMGPYYLSVLPESSRKATRGSA